MAIRYEIKSRPQIGKQDLVQMHYLRSEIFRKRLGWSVSACEGNETDEYDTDDALYMLMYGNENEVCGCWRLLNTQSPYMLENDFACLLHGQPVKRDANIWELSRFALKQVASRSFGFSEATLGAMRNLVAWAFEEKITEFLTVTTVSIYRLMASIGLDIDLYGPPVKIGSVMTVAMKIHISDKTAHALFGEQRKIA